MSIITGRRLNYLYKKFSKSIKEKIEIIEKKLENVLHSTEIDEYIFSDSKSGFVPKTKYKYDEEFRYLRADGKWENPASNDVIVKRHEYNIDAQDAAVTDTIYPKEASFYGGILLINVFEVKNAGSAIGATKLLASYAYSVVIDRDETDVNSDYYKEIVKIAALSSDLSSTYGTISAVNQSNEDNHGVVKIKVNKGYNMSIKVIY